MNFISKKSTADDLAISDAEYNDFVSLIYRLSGISLGSKKKDLVKLRLAKRMRRFNFESFREYYEYIIHDISGDEFVHLLDAISTNVTSFFRESKHFDLLSGKILPEIIERKIKKNDKRLRIWSAGCASGEEVYSIAIALREFFKDPTGWDIKVLGTDISSQALGSAKAGIYSFDKVKNIPRFWLLKYFREQYKDGKKTYQVNSALREWAYFARLNLTDEAFPFRSKLDIIFCRNVMIYFDKPAQLKLIKKIVNSLDSGGYFFIGCSESLIGIDQDFERIAPAVFKKKM